MYPLQGVHKCKSMLHLKCSGMLEILAKKKRLETDLGPQQGEIDRDRERSRGRERERARERVIKRVRERGRERERKRERGRERDG